MILISNPPICLRSQLTSTLSKGKLVSFFPLKDSFGITQLVVNHSDIPSNLSALSKVPVESTVLIEGTVSLRPPSARRPVSHFLSAWTTYNVVVLTGVVI